MDKENRILIATKENAVYFKAFGHVTANLCFPFRDMIMKRLSSFSIPFEIYFDLSETKYMDSTFLGILVGTDKLLYSKFQKHLYVNHPNEISLKLMKNMGLDRFLKFSQVTFPQDLSFILFDDTITLEEEEKTKIILESHQELSELSDENKSKFRTLQGILKSQLKK